MNTLQWRQIADFPHYEVSSDGRVRSWRRKSCTWRDQRSDVRESPIELAGSVTKAGYIAFILRKPDSSKPYRTLVHRLVAIAFLPNPDKLPEVAHEDGDPSRNAASNLRWSTHRDNQMDMRRHGTMQDGERCITAKVTESQAQEIRERLTTGPRGIGRRLAAEFGLSFAQVSRIGSGKRWASLA